MDETFEKHFKTKICEKKFKNANLTKDEVLDIVKDRNEICENRKTISGWDIGLFSPKEIIQDKTKCYVAEDAPFLSLYDNVNRKIRHKVEKLPYPSTMLTKYDANPPGCPIFKSSNPSVKFVYRDKDTPDIYKVVGSAIAIAARKIYRGVLKGNVSTRRKSYRSKHFLKLKPVYDINLSDIPRTKTIAPSKWNYKLEAKNPSKDAFISLLKFDLFHALKMHMSSHKFGLTKRVVTDLKKQNIRLDTNVKVYRGLAFSEFIWPVSVGDVITLEDKYPSSWTTDVCVAVGFSSNWKTGYVVSYEAEPSEIIIDTRLLLPKILKKLYPPGLQSELILERSKRKVLVEFIIYHKREIAKTSLDLPKEVQILDKLDSLYMRATDDVNEKEIIELWKYAAGVADIVRKNIKFMERIKKFYKYIFVAQPSISQKIQDFHTKLLG